MLQNRPLSVLVAPLDWGLGHATRCIPIIKEFINQGAQVTIATGGAQRALLEAEFPGLAYVDLPGYGIRYLPGPLLKWGLIFQVPRIRNQIQKEKIWLAKFLETHPIDLVVSDNRYGLYHPDIVSIFITHQLSIRSGLGPFFDHFLLKWNLRFIQPFTSCWIPDWADNPSLAGKLSHPARPISLSVEYIGILSRMSSQGEPKEQNSLLILISGPEPQRSQFEELIFKQLPLLTIPCTVLRGLPDSDAPVPFIRNGIRIFNHLPSDALNALLRSSAMVITRSGYSSLMDLVQLRKNAILVPTPGQTEQEYLGYHLQELKWMVTISQKKFNLVEALADFKGRDLIPPRLPEAELTKVVGDLLEGLVRKKCSKKGTQT